MNNDFDKIFNNNECISEEMFLKYLNDKASLLERNFIERHTLECPLCSDALEGLENTAITSQKFKDLRNYTSIKRNRKSWLYVAAAAASIVLAISLAVTIQSEDNSIATAPNKEDIEIAKNDRPETVDTSSFKRGESIVGNDELITQQENLTNSESNKKKDSAHPLKFEEQEVFVASTENSTKDISADEVEEIQIADDNNLRTSPNIAPISQKTDSIDLGGGFNLNTKELEPTSYSYTIESKDKEEEKLIRSESKEEDDYEGEVVVSKKKSIVKKEVAKAPAVALAEYAPEENIAQDIKLENNGIQQDSIEIWYNLKEYNKAINYKSENYSDHQKCLLALSHFYLNNSKEALDWFEKVNFDELNSESIKNEGVKSYGLLLKEKSLTKKLEELQKKYPDIKFE